jgi:RNA polymerase sigma factor (sigma-70 family)
MIRFRLDILSQLSRQMGFAPSEVRFQQLAAAEALLNLIDPAKAYPLEFVVFKITGYHPKQATGELLTGLALQHDLGLLIEQVSDTLDLHTAALAEPVLSIDDVCEKFNVTSKTIQRWRRKGLAARRFVYPDEKRRVGFLLGSVERFLATHGEQIGQAVNFTQVADSERDEMLRRGRRLALAGCCVDEITRRVAGPMNRSPLTVLHTIRKHDQEHPEQAIFSHAAEPIADAQRTMIAKAWRHGAAIGDLARDLGRPKSNIYRVILDERASRLTRRKVRFFDDPLYHQPDADSAINAILSQDELSAGPSREELRVPRDLPPYLQDLYRTPLLSKSRERALFLKLNFHKFQFVHARRRLEPERLRNRDLSVLESHLAKVAKTKNQIVAANLRLVVSVARKHLRPGIELLELVSDGNLTLIRAVDGFDIHRGYRFSTYATLALMKGFARSVPQMLTQLRQTSGDDHTLLTVADVRQPIATSQFIQRDELRQLLSRLSEREQSVLSAHFGLGQRSRPATYEQVGELLGLSKERVRQIEQGALAKLRSTAAVA